MSVREIIQHSLEKNPLAMKEALDGEMKARVAAAIEEKMIAAMSEAAHEDDDDDEDEDEEDDEDEDEDMDESFDLSEMNRAAALQKDKKHGFYADHEDGVHHVFGSSSGFSYGQHTTKSAAEKHAAEMTKSHVKESFDQLDEISKRARARLAK